MKIATNNFNYQPTLKQRVTPFSNSYAQPRLQPALKCDTVTFRGKNKNMTAEEKMNSYAIRILDKNNLKKGQKIYITSDSNYLPFVDVLTKEAYKKGSGLIVQKIVEPEIEALKKKYNIKEEFDYKKTELNEFKKDGALFLNFDKNNDPFKESKLTKDEIKSEQQKITTTIPENVRKEFKINPKEVLKDAMDIHKGQPVFLYGEREHLPYIVELADWLFSKNETKLVDVHITSNSGLNMLKYADDSVVESVPNSCVNREKEFYEKDVASLYLEGADPKFYDGVDTDRILKNSNARREAIKEYRSLTSSNVPWLVYYAPTTKSCAEAYSEYNKHPLDAITQAYKDANKINRVGKLDEHINSLSYRAEKLNDLIDKGYRTFHYVSLDEKTQKPDGKTDFRVKVSEKSVFHSARSKMDKYGHNPIVNIPTEEVFSAPLASSAEGKLSATKPFSINGKQIDDAQFVFKNGRIVEANSSTNADLLKSYIKTNKNADRLGEIALVAGSPIEKTGRVFNSVLLDENASCHFAIGNAYPDTVKGAAEIEGYKAQEKYLEESDINVSSIHNDFMVGGKNVVITAINDETGDKVEVIKEDKFLL